MKGGFTMKLSNTLLFLKRNFLSYLTIAKTSNTIDFSVYFIIFSFLVIMFVFMLVLRKVSGKGYIGNKSALKVKDRMYLSNDKQVIVVGVKDKNYILGISKDNIVKIDTLDSYEVEIDDNNNKNEMFKEVFKKMLKQEQKK